MSTRHSVCKGGKKRGLAAGRTKEDELAGQRDWATSIEYIKPTNIAFLSLPKSSKRVCEMKDADAGMAWGLRTPH
jgi:hypothetical protein